MKNKPLNDDQLIDRDLMRYGVAFRKNGKHLPVTDVVDPKFIKAVEDDNRKG